MKNYWQREFLIIALPMLFLSCCYSGPNADASRNQGPFEQAEVHSTDEVVEVLSLCELYENPTLFTDKTIKVKTTLYRTARVTTIGDDGCVTAHHLVDVEFTAEFESIACESGDKTKELCAIANATKQGTELGNFEIVGSIVGRFDYHQAKEGFTSNGLRFRFFVQAIKDVKKIAPIKAIRPT